MTENHDRARVSYEQLKSIMDFMGQHVEFAAGNLRTLEARHTSKRLWGELTKILNSSTGTRKSADGWSKHWSDFKNKLKNKVWLLKRKERGTVIKGIRPLTKMEKRALIILGPNFDKKRPRGGYSDKIANSLPPQVKLESCQEVTVNGFSKSQSESSVRLSGGDDGSNNSGESSDGEDVDDNDSIDPTLQNLYPKWLIEVEKKRADAELIRAKAEEQRVAVAAKNAEASLLQADALKRMADAASIQAQAITRIANILERRGHGEVIVQSNVQVKN